MLLLLLLRPAPRAGRPTAQPSCVPRSCPALAGKWAAGESRRAQAAGHGHRALGGGGRGSGLDAPRALRRWLLRRRDGCAFVPAAFCSFSPDSCCLCAAPSTWTWTVPPSTPAPREVTLASRWISSCPARLPGCFFLWEHPKQTLLSLGLWKEGKSSSVIGLPTAGASQLNLMQQVSVDAGLFS